jgi:hypothetical protein
MSSPTQFKKVCCCETSNIPHCLKCSNAWVPIPDFEAERLSKQVIRLTKNAGKSITKKNALKKTREILKDQNNTCAFGANKNGKYCFNSSKNDHLSYLKLEVSNITAVTAANPEPSFVFLCNRCNEIKSSRSFPQLRDELLSKLYYIMKYDKIATQQFDQVDTPVSAPVSPAKNSTPLYFTTKTK